MKKPLILVTNDDGIFAKGLRCLVEVAKEFGEVIIVAPDGPQSGMGHAVTISNILRIQEYDYELKGVRAYSTTGTPVDCVKLAIYEILKGRKPDLLLSGVNHGSNSSINVIYSGTMSAAVEGAVEGIPSLGFSLLDHDSDADFSGAQKYARQLIDQVLKNGMPHGICLNVNVPAVPVKELKGVRMCRQAKGYWDDVFEERKDPSGNSYYWITGEFSHRDKGEDTDSWALENNYVSVVPTQFDLTAHYAIAELNDWNFNGKDEE